MRLMPRARSFAARAWIAIACIGFSMQALAIDPQLIRDLAFGEGDIRDAAIAGIVASHDPRALTVLEAWRDGAARRRIISSI